MYNYTLSEIIPFNRNVYWHDQRKRATIHIEGTSRSRRAGMTIARVQSDNRLFCWSRAIKSDDLSMVVILRLVKHRQTPAKTGQDQREQDCRLYRKSSFLRFNDVYEYRSTHARTIRNKLWPQPWTFIYQTVMLLCGYRLTIILTVNG